MQVRLTSFSITEADRRAIRFHNDKRKTQASRNECKEFFNKVIEDALRDLRYRWDGAKGTAAELSGANVNGLASHNVSGNAPAEAAPATPEPAVATQGPVTTG